VDNFSARQRSGERAASRSGIRATDRSLRGLARGSWPHLHGQTGTTGDSRSNRILTPAAIFFHAVSPVLTGSAVQASPSLPVDMWTIGFQPNGCASPVLLRKDGEMLAFAHIPTGNNNKEVFLIFDFQGKGERGRGLRLPVQNPALRTSMRPRAPSRIKRRVRYFLLKGRGAKNLPVPRRQGGERRAFDRTAAAPLFSFAGSGRRDGFPGRT
jgi:hypothetical protein